MRDATAAVCFLCEADMKRRKPIHSSSNIHVPLIVNSGTSFLAAQVVCTPCLRKLEKVKELRATSASKEKKIKE